MMPAIATNGAAGPVNGAAARTVAPRGRYFLTASRSQAARWIAHVHHRLFDSITKARAAITNPPMRSTDPIDPSAAVKLVPPEEETG